MSTGNTRPQTSAPRSYRRWLNLTEQWFRVVLMYVCLAGVLYGVGECIVWHLVPVTSYTFSATSDPAVAPQMIVNDWPKASALRWQINSMPVEWTPLLEPIEGGVPIGIADPTYKGPECMETLNPLPVVSSFRYNFYLDGALVETAWSSDAACGGTWVTCGDRTVLLGSLPPLPAMSKRASPTSAFHG